MDNLLTLSDIAVGEYATVRKIDLSGSIRRRLADIGLTPDTRIKCVGVSPCGDPRAYLIRGAVIAIRRADTDRICIARASGRNGSD